MQVKTKRIFSLFISITFLNPLSTLGSEQASKTITRASATSGWRIANLLNAVFPNHSVRRQITQSTEQPLEIESKHQSNQSEAENTSLTIISDNTSNQPSLLNKNLIKESIETTLPTISTENTSTQTPLVDPNSLYEDIVKAVIDNNEPRVRKLLNLKADPNTVTNTYIQKDNNYKSLLMIAGGQENLAIVQLLLDNKADINFQAHKEITPSYIFTKLRFILRNLPQEICHIISQYYGDYPKIPLSIKYAIQRKHHINPQNFYGPTTLFRTLNTPLFTTISEREYKSRIAIAQLLIASQADSNLQDKEGYTCLRKALHRPFLSIIPLLIQHKANVNIQCIDGHSALVQSFPISNRDIVKQIINTKANLELIDKAHFTPLELSIYYGDDITQLLLENNANPFINISHDIKVDPKYKTYVNQLRPFIQKFLIKHSPLDSNSTSIITQYLLYK